MSERINPGDEESIGVKIYDSKGNQIGGVCGFQHIDGGLRVWIYARGPECKTVAGICDDYVAEFVADLPGAYVRRPNA